MNRRAWVPVAVRLLVAGTLLGAPSTGSAQVPPAGRGHPAAMAERRAELERRIRERFVEQLGRRVDLTDAQRSRLSALLEEGARARRALLGESRTIRHELMRAVREEETSSAVYERLLERMRRLRERERALEDREQDAMSRFLDPRQQAAFLFMRLQLNDRIRGMRGPGPGAGRGGGPGPGGGAGGGPGGSWPAGGG